MLSSHFYESTEVWNKIKEFSSYLKKKKVFYDIEFDHPLTFNLSICNNPNIKYLIKKVHFSSKVYK